MIEIIAFGFVFNNLYQTEVKLIFFPHTGSLCELSAELTLVYKMTTAKERKHKSVCCLTVNKDIL